jgi:hypothetical protein
MAKSGTVIVYLLLICEKICKKICSNAVSKGRKRRESHATPGRKNRPLN